MSDERPRADVVLIGAGVIGCAAALALAEAGLDVLLVESRFPGAEASSAAAGILGAQAEAHAPGPFHELARRSLDRYPTLARHLSETTGIDIELRPCGVTALADSDAGRIRLREQARWQTAAGLSVKELDAAGIARVEPRLASGPTYGLHFATDARVEPPSLVRALHAAAVRAGARFRVAHVARVRVIDGVVGAVVLSDGNAIACANVVVTAGSWSSLIDGVPSAALTVQPARGQLVELRTGTPLMNGVVFGPHCYLVPRDDGRVLVGSTIEFVGYERAVTAGAIGELLKAAIVLAPELAGASFVRAWSSFRPYTPRDLPLLSATGTRGLFLATGHHRNGILLAPVSAAVVRALVLNEPPPLDLTPFSAGDDARPAT